MKKLITGALALLLITGAAQAQKSQNGKEHRSHQMEQLNLTPEQKAKIAALRTTHKQEWTQWKQQNSPSDEAAKARKKEMMQQHRAQINEILTPEQRQQMQQMRSQHRGKGTAKMQGRGKVMMQDLNLTNAQQTKMKALHQDFRTKRQSLKSNTALSETQKKEQMKALAQQHRQEVKAVLSPEQQQKIEAMRKDFRTRTGK